MCLLCDDEKAYQAYMNYLDAMERQGRVDFTSLWAGQAIGMGRAIPAAELTRDLADAAQARLKQLAR